MISVTSNSSLGESLARLTPNPPPANFNDDYATNTWFLYITLLLGVSGTLGNILVIGSVLVYVPLQRLPNTYIVNLACADLCVSAIIQFSTVHAILGNGEMFTNRPGLCEFFGFLCTTSCTCSLWSITAISVNRYVCICHNSMYHRIYTPGFKVAIMIACLWFGSFLMDLPAFLGWGAHSYDPKVMFCTFDYTASFSYTISLVSVAVGVPMLLISFCYVRILIFVWASRRMIRRLSCDAKAVGAIHSGGGKQAIRRRDMTLLRTVVTLWVVFILMWSPYTVYVLFDTNRTWNRTLYVIFVNMCHANSCVNCVIYAATNPAFRRGYVVFVRLLLCLQTDVTKRQQIYSQRRSSSAGKVTNANNNRI